MRPIQYTEPEPVLSNTGIALPILQGKKVLVTSEQPVVELEDSITPKRGRPPKKKHVDMNIEDSTSTNLNSAQSNVPYTESYNESNMLLRGTIYQIDSLNSDIQSELTAIKASKTLKKKFDYIAALAGTSGTLLGTKITAIREMNKVITDCHNLEIKKIKDLKIENAQNDDKYIMDMYNAIITAPPQMMPSMAPSIMDATINPMHTGFVTTDIGSIGGGAVTDPGFQNYLNTMTPEQNRMRYENNPNIKTIVRYDPNSGMRRFDVVDTATGAPIPNMPLPPDVILEDLVINTRTGIARNSNTNMDFPIFIEGGMSSIDQY